MNKNTVLGLLVIGAILFGYSWYTSRENLKEMEAARARNTEALRVAQTLQTELSNPNLDPEDARRQNDLAFINHYGQELFDAANAEEKLFTVENELVKMTISNKGAKVIAVEMKEYNSFDGNPVQLITDGTSRFDLNFFIKRDYTTAQINTGDYVFSTDMPQNIVIGESDGSKELRMRLDISPEAYLEYVYTIPADSYMLDFSVNFVGMQEMMGNQSDFMIEWAKLSPQNERSFKNENLYTTVFFKHPGDTAPQSLRAGDGKREEDVRNSVKWVAFKQQFFSSILVAKENNFNNALVKYDTQQEGSGSVKAFAASLSVPYYANTQTYDFNLYFGPNRFSILRSFDIGIERLVPLGGWGIGWINRLIVIPVFDFLSKFIASFGLIIFLLTLFIKLLIFPLTYKTYLSTAKMRLLKPEIDEINAKFPKQEDALKKQQATMALYKKAGVSPLGGCLPMLIQFPILIAMFRFFPSSIELRGQSFLWAHDLSSYDSILSLPFKIPFYGDHVSLFALLMAVSIFVSSKMSMSQTMASTPQMPGMKFMMLYMMPVMMLLWFNSYASGLSYYFLLSNLITIGQNYAFRGLVNDEKLHAKMKANAKKPHVQKKSKWQQRYDEMVKTQQQQLKQKQQRKK